MTARATDAEIREWQRVASSTHHAIIRELVSALVAEREANKPVETIAKGLGFHGCDNTDPYQCSCETWRPVECEACTEELSDGEAVLTLTRPMYPALPADHPDQEWEYHNWHKTASPRPGVPVSATTVPPITAKTAANTGYATNVSPTAERRRRRD